METINIGNDELPFDPQITAALKCYVYVLRDPRDRKIFYVGKAGGEGQGNQRVLDHFDEAKKALNDPAQCRSPKVQRIIEIWSADEDVEWFIVRWGLDPTTAMHVEAAVIDVLDISQNGPTLNSNKGFGVNEHGILSSEEVYGRFAAQLVNPPVPYDRVFIFPIHNALKEDRDVYDATRRCWQLSTKFQHLPAIAVGVAKGISRGVFNIVNWKQGCEPNKWEFDGTNLNPHPLLNCNFYTIISRAMGYFQRGNYLVVEFDGNGNFRFLRGSANRQWQPL
ncbi:MAG: GIY-YIG nuclease family protein [Methylococcaceae bacterium]|nr:GIY-YIG nuclease family protein [Methylococcaceae bacterium]